MSTSWVRSKFKVTQWVQHPIHSNPFCSMSISPSTAQIQLFQNWTLKFQGQVQGWGQNSGSHCESYFLLTDIAFVSCQSAITFLWCRYLKIGPWLTCLLVHRTWHGIQWNKISIIWLSACNLVPQRQVLLAFTKQYQTQLIIYHLFQTVLTENVSHD